MKRFWSVLRARLIMLLRDRTSLVFAFIVPIVLVCFFGFILHQSQDILLRLSVYQNTRNPLINDVYDVLDQAHMFEVTYETDLAKAQEDVRIGKKDYILVLNDGPNGGVELEMQYGLRGVNNYDTVIEPLLYGITQQANFYPLVNEVLPDATPEQLARTTMFSLRHKVLSGSEVDTTIVGINGWLLQAMIIFSVLGLARLLAEERQAGILKHIALTPVRPWEYIAGSLMSVVIIGTLQFGLFIALSYQLFDIQWHNSGWLLIASIGITLMTGLCGAIIGALSRTVNTAMSAAPLIMLPLIILSGAWFPIWIFPDWLQRIVQYSPLTQAKNLLDQIAAVAVPEVQLMTVGILLITILILWFFTLMVFRFQKNSR